MPELPEVETVRRGLEHALVGTRVRAVEVFRTDLRWPIPTERVHALVGRRFAGAARRSKYLLLEFSGTPALSALVHLGMSGRLFVATWDVRRPLPRLPHEHWRIRLGSRVLRYVDPRRFGALDVVDTGDVAQHRLLRDLGPEPLGSSFDGAFLHGATRKRSAPIKTFLMDARNVVGVGNIYAAEALFRARVRPTRPAGRLGRAACDALATAVRSTLGDAVAAGGTTIRDYIGVDRRSGRFQQQLAVYGRAGEPCPECQALIRRLVLGGRSTFFCPRCQR
ncbi:MAG: bifunctional DNA-formamidopyrimidine glycosylase/DNA-(apurinic or apyrimidinic site) lyase [Planctomycetota bacterium]